MATTLPTSILGRTGLEVTRLGFGCALWRPDRPNWTPGRARKIWYTALDAGINFFDTAYDYVFSEEWIGWALSPRYDEFHLATKCGCTDTMPTVNDSNHSWTRDNLFRNIEISLRRLNRNSIDIIQLHNATSKECEAGGLVRILSDMRDQGMVKWIGASTTLPHLPVYLDWGVFDVFQIPYAAVLREHEMWITSAAEAGIGTVIRGGVGKGEPGVGVATEDRWAPYNNAGLDDLLEEGETPTAFMLRYTLAHPNVHTVIAGTLNPDHLTENVSVAKGGGLPEDTYAEAKRRLDAVGENPSAVV